MKRSVVSLWALLCLSPLHAADFWAAQKENLKRASLAAESQQNWLAARNAWYKYIRMEEMEPSADRPALARLQNHLRELDECLRPEPPAVSVVVEQPRPAVRPQTDARPRLSADELMKKAQLLQQNGQLDEALRFYQLAEKENPGAPELKQRMEALRQEMN